MSLLSHTPTFSIDDAIRIASERFGIEGRAGALPGERDQNFLIETIDNSKYVLKIANELEDRDLLDAQNEALLQVSRRVDLCQKIVPATSGEAVVTVESPAGTRHLTRLVTFLEGRPLGTLKRHSKDLLYDVGRAVGLVDDALSDFDHPAAHRVFHWDLARGVDICREYRPLIADAEMLAFVDRTTADFERDTAPLLPDLRRGVIHNDANDYNILVGGGVDLYSRDQTVVGLIDFGDIVSSFTVGGLAIAIAYAILEKPEPLATAAAVVAGYNSVRRLEENEIKALWGMIRLRLAMSVALAAHQQSQRPDDDYLAISQAPIRDTLPKLAAVNGRFAEAVFRRASGLLPVEREKAIVRYLERNRTEFAPVIEYDASGVDCLVIDLGVESTLVGGAESESDPDEFSKRLGELLRNAGKKFAIGQYDEPRLIYTSDIFGSNKYAETRTIHLGIDIFAEAGAPVFAPLAGEVFLLAYNPAPLDYGHLVVLKHTADEVEFFTLYGHLSKETLSGLNVGQRVGKGAKIATIGRPEENGGWSPHLHFQIITDLLELGADFPGVALPGERDVWRSLSPDPNLILGFPETIFPPPPPVKAATLAKRRERVGSSLRLSYREPLKIVRGRMQYLFDETGRRFLDAYNNVPHVGHSHPRIVEALCGQASLLNTNTRYLHDRINSLAEKLAATMPEPLEVCYFVNSASEANELALRLARTFTGNRDVIVLEAAYHGNTGNLIDISPYKHAFAGGSGAPDWVHTAPLADVYRGRYKHGEPEAGPKYAAAVGEIVENLRRAGKAPAAFIAESVPSVGGQIFFPQGYLEDVYKFVRAGGGVCIADDVQTGYGRIGTDFYGFEAQRVVPDIVVLGKPMGNGHPLAAVVTTADIADAFDNGMEFFSTFGGNPVSCAVGLEVLSIVLEEGLQTHALGVGRRLLDGFEKLKERFSIIGDVRGSGLFLGVELVRDRETLEPADAEAALISDLMRERGVLLGTDGPFHNVIKIRPPMPFDLSDAEFLLARFESVLAEVA